MSIDMPSPWIILVAIGLVLLAYGILAPERMALPVLRDHGNPLTAGGTADAFAPSSGAVLERPSQSHGPLAAPQPDAPPQRSEPAPSAENARPSSETVSDETPSWPSLIDDRARALDAATRKNMIVALGALSEAWCGPILARAYESEPTVEMRSAVIAAIRDGRYIDESQTLAHALRAQSEQERILAIEAFAAIGRYDDLAGAIEDPSVPVATAAAYQLVRAHGAEHVAALLRERTDGTRLQHIDDLLELFA